MAKNTSVHPQPHIPIRQDRLFPLSEAASYPGSATLDMVLYFPAEPDRRYRLWLFSPVPSPEIRINDRAFRPKPGTAGGGWHDFGVIDDLAELIGPRGFGHITYVNVPAAAVGITYCVITAQIDEVLNGAMRDVERKLWGLAREDAGVSSISPSTMAVGRSRTFVLRYGTGSQGLPPGAFLRFCVPKAFSEPQMEDPDIEGWTQVLESPVTLEPYSIDTSVESHEKFDIIYRLPDGIGPEGVIRLSYQTDTTYIHPEAFGRAERTYWYSRLPPLSVAAALDKRMLFVAPLEERAHRVEFVPGPARRLHLFLPGRRRAGEAFKLKGVVTDKFRNAPAASWAGPSTKLVLDIADPQKRQLELCMRSTSRACFEASLPDLQPGLYRCRALDLSSGTTLGTSNPLSVVGTNSRTKPIYWGEIHGHSEMSDGSGDFTEMFRLARDRAAFDFAAGADHACYFSNNQWLWMQDVVNAFNCEGSFVTLIGYEWAGDQGHRNIYTNGDRHELFRGMYPPTSRLDTVYSHFHGREDVVAGPHVHHTHDFYDGHDPAVQRFMEIYSMWGDHEHLAFDVLNKGATIGFTGGGDNHEGHLGFSVEDRQGQGSTSHTFARTLYYKCGITGAVMDSLSRRSLVAALRNRSTYATTGARVLLDFSLNGIAMGGNVPLEGNGGTEPAIAAEVHGCAAIESIDVVRDGITVHSLKPGAMDVDMTWRDPEPVAQRAWYCLRVRQVDGEKAWSSPIWVEPPADG